MITVANDIGRLLAVEIATPVTDGEVAAFRTQLGAVIARTEIVVVGKLDQITVLPQPISDAFIAIMRADNPRLVRSAFLVGNATFGLQLERMIREAENPQRKTFRDAKALMTWVSEVLTPEERRVAASFLV